MTDPNDNLGVMARPAAEYPEPLRSVVAVAKQAGGYLFISAALVGEGVRVDAAGGLRPYRMADPVGPGWFFRDTPTAVSTGRAFRVTEQAAIACPWSKDPTFALVASRFWTPDGPTGWFVVTHRLPNADGSPAAETYESVGSREAAIDAVKRVMRPGWSYIEYVPNPEPPS